MEDYGISLSQIPETLVPSSFQSYVTPTLSSSPTPPQTPQQPIIQGIKRRPHKQSNPDPLQISRELALLDNELVDTFSKLAELVDHGIRLVKNNTEQKFLYNRLQELRDDFDTLVIVKQGGRRKTYKKSKSKSKSKSKRK